jgi:cytochrome c553
MKILNFFSSSFILFLIFFLNPSYALNQDDAVATKAKSVCAACHGKDGINAVLPSYPILAGQHEDYLNQALLDYKSGARQNAVMSGIASTLTRDDIKGLSNYFASLPGPLSVKKRK